MLAQLLEEIQRGETLQPAALAHKMNISVGLVQAMLENLERMGRLKQISTDCGDACGDCSLGEACGDKTRQKGRVWRVTTQDGE